MPNTSAAEIASAIDGSFFAGRKAQPALAYGQSKYIAALWLGSLARRQPPLRFITLSPGNTAGTELSSGMPLVQRVLIKQLVLRIGRVPGLAHPLEAGAKRLVDGVTARRRAVCDVSAWSQLRALHRG